MKKRNLYLTNTPIEEALEKFLNALKEKYQNTFEKTTVTKAYGRVTAQTVFAINNSPLYNCAAMDGIAVIAAGTKGASETAPLELKDYVYINTGDPIKDLFDAVIMAEDIQEIDETTVLIRQSAAQGQNIRMLGEDIKAGEEILPKNHLIRAIDIGMLLSAGITEIEVFKLPKIAVFPTGSELIEIGVAPKEGQIIESNTRMIESLIKEEGFECKRFDILPDNPLLLETAIESALKEFDMVIINAGSSAGTKDYTADVLKKLGNVIVHGVATKPGKPVILSIVTGKPVIGLPGYPVSAYLAYRNFVLPVLEKLSAREAKTYPVIEAVITKRLVSSLKHREYVCVKIDNKDGKLTATPLARGASAAMSLVRADGFCIIEQNCEGLEAGETVKIELL